MDVQVAVGSATSTVHFEWSSVATVLTSDACGGLSLIIEAETDLRLDMDAANSSAACAGFAAAYDAEAATGAAAASFVSFTMR